MSPKNPPLLPTWAPRIKPYRIRQLYESDALGRLDEQLVDDVGWALYSRCDSFLQAGEAARGRVRCPACGEWVLHHRKARQVLHCAACGWECPLSFYLGTIKNQQLDGGPEVAALFQQYVDQFPRAKAPAEKMLLIDGLIHGFHHFLSSGRTRRPVGVNLIDGPLQFVIDFLDQLTYGPLSTPGLEATHSGWQAKVHGQVTGGSKSAGGG